MKKILAIVFICLLLLPVVSIDAKTKSSSGSSMPSTSVNKNHNSSSTYKNNSTYNPYYRSRSYYGGFSFPWLWIILMDSDEEQIQAYCVPLADTNGDGEVDDSEATVEYQDCVKQYSSFSILGFLISLAIVVFIFRIIMLLIFKRKRR